MQPPQQHSPPPQYLDYGHRPEQPAWTGVWISAGIGLLILFMYPRFWQWLGSALFGSHFDPFVLPDGTIVPYPHTPEFWADLGPATLALMLFFEAAALALIQIRAIAWLLLGFITLMLLYNAGYLVRSYSSQGLAVISAIAVIIGAVMISDLLKKLQKQKGPGRGEDVQGSGG